MSSLVADNYGSFGDDNTSDEDDDDDDNDYYESGEPPETFPDPDNNYPEFGVPNTGSFFTVFTHRRSVAKRGGCFQCRPSVCLSTR